MSCSTNKTDATTEFNAASFSSSVAAIKVLEKTEATNNKCTLTVVRGKIRLDLSGYTTTGSCITYFKVAPQSTGSSNNPPVTANNTYIAALSATMGQVNTSSYYANITPTFTSDNDCSGTEEYGWLISDQVGAVRPNFTYNC